MDQTKGLALLKSNFKKVEDKFDEFFSKGEPRWPGESRDYLRNHHKALDHLPIGSLTFAKLECRNLPDPIMTELQRAFDAFGKGVVYQ